MEKHKELIQRLYEVEGRTTKYISEYLQENKKKIQY